MATNRKLKKLTAVTVVSPDNKSGNSISRPKLPRRSLVKPITVRRVKGSPDYVMLSLVLILTVIGLISVYSASYAYSYTINDDSFYYIRSQSIYAGLGLAAMFGVMYFLKYDIIKKWTVPFYIGTLGLLGLVLIYGLAAGEAKRWIKIGGQSFQPSEIAKFAVVIILALYISSQQNKIINYDNFLQSMMYGIVIPGMILAVPCGLILAENHFSGTLIVFAIGAILIFASGARKDVLAGLVGLALLVVIVGIIATPYARTRVDMYLHPENYDPKGTIWQTLQGLYAIGSGGMFGVGFGNSKQKYLFVSQPMNDFIFSIFCEEMGFVGAIIVICLFALLVYRGIRTAMKAPDTFSSLVALGITGKLAIQTILNIAVVTNTIPNTGISLPFFSSGGTAIMMQLGEMGVLLGISRYTYVEKRKDVDDEGENVSADANGEKIT